MSTPIEHPLEDSKLSSSAAVIVLAEKWKLLLAASLAAGAFGYGGSFLIKPTFTAKATFISPQQQQNSASAALASLGALSGLAGAAAGIKSPADQYVSLMQSANISNRIIEKFNLIEVYGVKYKVDARKQLASQVQISAGKKDNIISIEVDDNDPSRAADITNSYIEELRKLTNSLSLTEAQIRRKFFEASLKETRAALKTSLVNLQQTGFNPGALKNEPKAAAEAYAKSKAELTASEVKLNALRSRFTEQSTEVQQQLAVNSQLKSVLNSFEFPALAQSNQDYISAYRDYRYQEALLEIYSRQFEIAKMDEAREGTIIQVLDIATIPEKRSKPRRSIITAIAFMLGSIVSSIFIIKTNILTRQRRKLAP
ncbi:Wzz/FepE/Etk N-terminal domain-containing protein [Paucibacter sp. AS339]|uniref:Wzz/FepE/Etk N-terminal domain-containing protein n=1 Tax=Paucibacter hankyongi TaxID=3133434 RepID=UPI0030B3830B